MIISIRLIQLTITLKKNELNHVADFAEQNTTQKRKRHSVIHLNTYILVMLQKDEYKFWEVK